MAASWRLVDLRRKAKELGLQPYARIERTDGRRGVPRHWDLEQMIAGAEAMREWRSLGATKKLFYLRVARMSSGRHVTNPWLPLSESEAVETLRGLLDEGRLEDWARWLMHANPGNHRSTEEGDLRLHARCFIVLAE